MIWSTLIHTKFLVFDATRDYISHYTTLTLYRTVTFFGLASQLIPLHIIQLKLYGYLFILYPSTPYMQRRQLIHIHGLGSSPFARRYLENRFYFLFLPLLRCFSSRTYLSRVYSPSIQVLPFGYLCLLRLLAP